MQLLFMALFAAVIVVVDQLVKFWTVANISLYEHVDFIPKILGLTYVQNTGAAFSALEGARWLFILVFLLLTGFMVYEYFFKRMAFTTFDRWCIAAVYAGGLGNVIDRVRLGYVVDMFATEFMEFPVFNVADCFISCGCILLMVHLLFFNRQFWKDDKK